MPNGNADIIVKIKAFLKLCYVGIRLSPKTVTYTYRNHLDEKRDYTEEFDSFPDFRNYWRWQPERAKVINGEKVENARTTNARLSLSFQDDEHSDEIPFGIVTDLTDYLKENAHLVQAVQYL